MAGDRGRGPFLAVLSPRAGQAGEEVQERLLDPARRGFDRRRPHVDGPLAEALNFESEGVEALAVVGRRRDQARFQLHDLGQQQRLAGGGCAPQPAEEAVVEDPLVGCVLVDQDDPIRPFGHQVAVQHLAQWAQQGCRRGGGRLDLQGDVTGTRRGTRGHRLQRHREDPRTAQRGQHRALDQAVKGALVAEADLALGRMHVDVDLRGRECEVEDGDRVAAALQPAQVGLLERVLEAMRGHRPRVDRQHDGFPAAPA